jgi:beta-mannosidase
MLTTTSLHAGWEFIQSSREHTSLANSKVEWLPAQVPGHVHLDLIQNGIIADPFVQMNELGCQWVDDAEWSYRTKFDWSPKEGLPRRELKFEGLDTVCTVFLNGKKIAEHDNMFVPLSLDVTKSLKEGENELRIDFQSAVKVGEKRKAKYLASEGMKPDQEYFFDRSFVRKAQYMFGWDWGPRLVSCGIWRPVSLVEFESRITDVHVTYEWPQPDVVVVKIATQCEGEGVVIHALEGAGSLIGDGAFVLKDPELWSPDEPNTLRLTTGIYPLGEDLEPFQIEPEALDEESIPIIDAVTHALLVADSHDATIQHIGIAKVDLVRQADEFGESFEFVVNGRRIWARGANWIPDHSFPATVSRERLREQLERCLDMGFNMLRVWGGGLYESDDFYELCDEMGILVWQDFPFGCAYYPDDKAFQKVIAEEAYTNILRLRNHPCLALWCGNNENHEMYHNGWGGMENRPKRYYGLPLYEGTLPEVLAKADPCRSYIPSSPIGTPPQEKKVDDKRTGPNADSYGDQHNWDVWHGRGDWRFYSDSKGRFSSEYGFGSSCGLECWNAAGVDASADFMGPVVRWHDKTNKGYETFVGYTKLHYPDPVTLEDWIYFSQLNQRDALRHGVEHYRRSEFCRGSLIWQVNDCWPVQSWAILDSLGNYKALAYELRRLYADQLLSLERKNEILKLWVANDGQESWVDNFALRAFHTVTGELLREWETEAEFDSDSRGVILEVDATGLNVNETIVVATAFDGAWPVWRLLGEPKSTRFPSPEPITVSTKYDGFIRIKTTTPLVDLMLTDGGSVKNLADNFITVAEAGMFDVRVGHTPTKLEARSLAGKHPVIVTRSPI